MLGRAQIRNAPAKSVAAKSVAAKSVAAKRPSPWQNTWQGLWRQAGWGLEAATGAGAARLSSATGRTPAKQVAAKSGAAKRPSAWQSPWQGLWRQAGWGLAAAAALGVAVLSSRDGAAPQKVAALLSSLRSQQPPTAHSFDAETAARQLAQ